MHIGILLSRILGQEVLDSQDISNRIDVHVHLKSVAQLLVWFAVSSFSTGALVAFVLGQRDITNGKDHAHLL